jgi:hypothetical protein
MPTHRTHAEYCALLEIGMAPTPEELRRGHQRLVMLWHPDRFEPASPLWVEAQQKIKDINEAYRFLQENARPAPLPAPPRKPAPRPAGGRLGWWVAVLAAVAVLVWARVGPRQESPAPSPERGVLAPAPPRGAPVEARTASPEGEPPATLVVDEAALVIFWPSRKELEDAPAPRAAEIAQFLESAHDVRDRLLKLRPDLKVILTEAELIQIQGVAVRRSQTCGFGYLVFAPPKRQLLLQGFQGIEKMVGCVCENFPLQDGRTSPEQAL